MKTFDHTVEATSINAPPRTRLDEGHSRARHRRHLAEAGTATQVLGVPAAAEQGAHLRARPGVGGRLRRRPRPRRSTPAPGRRWRREADRRSPSRCSRSARLTAVATTSSSTSPGPTSGSGTSAYCSASGPPGVGTTTACIWSVVERVGAVVDAAVVGQLVVDVVGVGRPGRMVPALGEGLGPSRELLDLVGGRRRPRRRRSRGGRS